MKKKILADGLHIFDDPKWEGGWRCELWSGQHKVYTCGKTVAMANVGQMVLALTLGPGAQEEAMSLLGRAAERLMDGEFFKAVMKDVRGRKEHA